MQYKTIALELLKGRKGLYDRLRQTRQLLPTLETYARDLKTSHETWMETLAKVKPNSQPSQIASESLEMAIKELENRLPFESPPDGGEPLSLDDAMAFVRSRISNG